MAKLVEFILEWHIFPKFSQKLTRIFGERKTLLGMGENHILFKLDFGKNSPVTKSLQTNWFAFSQSILPTVANPCPHLRSSSVYVLAPVLPNFTSYFGF